MFFSDEDWWLTIVEKRATQEPGIDLAGDDVPDEDLTMDAREAGASSSSSDACGDDDPDDAEQSQQDDDSDMHRCDDEQDLHSRHAVSRALKADVATLFAQARRAK